MDPQHQSSQSEHLALAELRKETPDGFASDSDGLSNFFLHQRKPDGQGIFAASIFAHPCSTRKGASGQAVPHVGRKTPNTDRLVCRIVDGAELFGDTQPQLSRPLSSRSARNRQGVKDWKNCFLSSVAGGFIATPERLLPSASVTRYQMNFTEALLSKSRPSPKELKRGGALSASRFQRHFSLIW